MLSNLTIMEAIDKVGCAKVSAAEEIYRNNYSASEAELLDLGFTTENPSKEYIREAVLETLAEVWMAAIGVRYEDN